MFPKFDSITRDFRDDLDSIRVMVSNLNLPSTQPRVRIKSTQSAILLIAADYEEYVRQMAHAHARTVAASASATKRLKEEAWRSTFRKLSQTRIFNGGNEFRAQAKIDSEATIKSLFSFMTGEFDTDILHLAIRNQQNMKPSELNAMFKLSGVDNIANKICELDCLIQYFNADDSRMAHSLFVNRQNEFFLQRNNIAHSRAAVSSVSAEAVESHIELFDATAQAMTEYLVESCLNGLR